MNDIQNEINERVEAFVAEIAELARQAAHDALSSALTGAGNGVAVKSRRASVGTRVRRQGGKRTSEELASMADAFLEHVASNPGQRMEQISKALGYTTTELTLPVKKLLSAGSIQVEGQKRATQYYAASDEESSVGKASGSKTRRRKGRRRKKS